MQVKLLGGVFATNGNELLDSGPPKCQAVLAALALAGGQPVPVGRLAELVWGEDAPRTADKTLQSYVTRLRKGLGADSIERIGAAYRLAVEPSAVDAVAFLQLARDGSHAAALDLWAGQPLAGLDAPGLQGQIDGLVEQWLSTVEAHLETQVEADPNSVIGELTSLTAQHPFREGLWALLMTALYRLGRQADALSAYQSARDHLVEGLGVEPGPQLRQLEQAILGQDADLIAPASTPALDLPAGVVTFVFCDVVDGASLWRNRNPEKAEALHQHLEIIDREAATYSGHVFAQSGESVGVVFHRVTDAVAWVRSTQAAFESTAWPAGLELQSRFGIHAGEAEQRGGDYFGPAVNLAAQLASAAHPDQVLLSAVATALAQTGDLLAVGSLPIDSGGGEENVTQLGRAEHPPLASRSNRSGNLPRLASPLFGRSEALDRCVKQLENSPLVTLIGPGGIGKTRLAIEAARQFSNRHHVDAFVVELAAASHSSEVARIVAETLDIQVSPSRPVVDTISAALEHRPLLLVLDNCEHVIAGAAELASELVARCSEVSVLATSREGLGIDHELINIVAPLGAEAGTELFNARAAAASPSFQPGAEPAAVAEICERLDGVPLAIELAAARVRTLEPADVVERLDDHLRLLTGGRRGSVERHRTLRATIQWSYDLLGEGEQELLRQLAIFAGPFDLNAAATVSEKESAVVDERIDALVGQSMVVVGSGPFGRRLRLLETVRQFAAEQLSTAGQTDAVAHRHALWCAEQVRLIGDKLGGHDEIEAVARLAELWSNLRVAMDWVCDQGLDELAHQLIRPIATEIGSRASMELGDWAERVLAITPPTAPDRQALALCWVAHRYMLNRDTEAFDVIVGPYRDLDHPLVSHAVAFVIDDDEQVLEHSGDAIEWFRANGEEKMAAMYEISSHMGPLLALGRFEEFENVVHERLEHLERHGPPTIHSWTLFCLGFAAMLTGRADVADVYIAQAAAIELPERTLSVSRPFESRLELARGNTDKAIWVMRDFIREMFESDNIMVARIVACEFVLLALALGDREAAATMMGHVARTDWGQMGIQSFLADAMTEIESDPALTLLRDSSPLDTDRASLEFMQSTLQKLVVARQN